MRRFVLTRIGYSALSLLLLSLTIFAVVRATGDPAVLLVGPGASRDDIAQARTLWGLDAPWPQQYVTFLGNALRGNLGTSFQYRVPVRDLYFERLPNSLLLAAVALLISLVLGVPLGIISAVRVDTVWDSLSKLVAMFGLSVPNFFIGLVMINIFAVWLRWLPAAGIGTWQHLVMPSVALGWYFAASMLRLTRSSMLEVLDSEYIKLARLKGLPETVVIVKHAFKNALIPVLTLAGINLVIMINVAVIIESIFAWPGIGRLLYEGISFRDFPVVQGLVVLAGGMIVGVNLLLDVLYAWIDPRIRYA
jgi:ABC-type dipeptide/oligopeptide/nickel transport system permease component